jgi:hypothetical protein
MAAETSGTPANLPQVRVSDAERETIVRRGGHWRLDRDMEIGTVVGSVKVYRR